jgi:hypothetical protein
MAAAACTAAAALAGPLVEPAAERRSDAMPEVGIGEAEPRNKSRRSAGFGMRRVDRKDRPPELRSAMGLPGLGASDARSSLSEGL